MFKLDFTSYLWPPESCIYTSDLSRILFRDSSQLSRY